MFEKLGLSGAVGSQEGVCCCMWLCLDAGLQAVRSSTKLCHGLQG
jgi:hypothetical protein